MSRTLLDLTQSVLRSIGGDEVNSIGDTVEASDIADIIKDCYENILATYSITEIETPFTLSAKTGPLMERPDDIMSVKWIKYNKQESGDPFPTWYDVKFLPIEDFTLVVTQLPSKADSTYEKLDVTLNGSVVSYYLRNNEDPTYFTTLDDKLILFDSYNSTKDANLQESKTMCFGSFIPTFSKTDSFVIPFDFKTTKLLEQDSKAQASVEERQTQNPKAEASARRLKVRSQIDNRQVGSLDYYQSLTGYGRK